MTQLLKVNKVYTVTLKEVRPGKGISVFDIEARDINEAKEKVNHNFDSKNWRVDSIVEVKGQITGISVKGTNN